MKRRNVVTCRGCGKIAERTHAKQVYCGQACQKQHVRREARTAIKKDPPLPRCQSVRLRRKNINENSGLETQFSGSSVPYDLVGRGFRWPGATLDPGLAQKIIQSELQAFEPIPQQRISYWLP